MDERWAMAFESGRGVSHGPVGMTVPLGRKVLVGREGDLPLGVQVPDPGVSRRAVEVTAVAEGWRIDIQNTNRAVLHAWGQAPILVTGEHLVTWPRAGLQVLSGDRPGTPNARVHWLLLEADSISVTPAGPRAGQASPSRTFSPEPPPPLTDEQEAAVRAVFAARLAWPPRLNAEPATLASVARLLKISDSAVQERLKKVQAKAVQLGLPRAGGLTDPDYVYTLVRDGYLAPPREHLPRTLQPWRG